MECTWDESLENGFESKKHLGELEGVEPPYKDFNGITSKFGRHFILKIDKILMVEKYAENLKQGLKRNSFPKVPVDYGYHDSKNLWYMRFGGHKPIAEPIAASNSGSVKSAMYCAERLDTPVKFAKEACELYVKIPRPFMVPPSPKSRGSPRKTASWSSIRRLRRKSRNYVRKTNNRGDFKRFFSKQIGSALISGIGVTLVFPRDNCGRQ